jgi:PhoH-like ATPase
MKDAKHNHDQRLSIEKSGAEAIIIDTNVAIHDPESIDVLRENGRTLFIPLVVIHELDALKDKPDIGIDAREALRRIEELTLGSEKTLRIIKQPYFKGLDGLDKKQADHQVIAAANTVYLKMKEFANVALVSRDRPVRILAREFGFRAEDYTRDETEVSAAAALLPTANVPRGKISSDFYFPHECVEDDLCIPENGGVVCHSDWGGYTESSVLGSREWGPAFAAIRKDDRFKIIPSNINAVGLKPYSLNGNGPNWHQYTAFTQLLDPSISLVFLQGGAGSGKTLLAMAAAIEMRSHYRRILITRPMVHLEDQNNMGFLPGDIEDKTGPWMRPIYEAIDYIKEVSGPHTRKIIEEMYEHKKFTTEPLDYIRGMSFYKCLLIVDEAQNLTPHQVKTIITRAGEGTTIIFTGDLGQIDLRRRLDRRSSGLSYAISRMVGNEEECRMVAVTNFKETVRSDLAKFAEKKL